MLAILRPPAPAAPVIVPAVATGDGAAGVGATEGEIAPVAGEVLVEGKLADGTSVMTTLEPDAPEPGEPGLDAVFGSPVVVSFASVTNRKFARRLLIESMGENSELRAIPNRDDLWEMRQPVEWEVDGEMSVEQGIFGLCRLVGREAYLGDDGMNGLVDGIGEMHVRPSELAAQHDIAASFQLQHLSPQARQILHKTLWNITGPALQPRDVEAPYDAAWRDAWDRGLVELTDLVITDLAAASASFDLLEASSTGRARIELHALPGSNLAHRLENLDGPASHFGPLIKDDAALSILVSLRLSEHEQRYLARWVQFLETIAAADSTSLEQQYQPLWSALMASFRAAIEAGHLDFFCQCEVSEEGRFIVVGGLHLPQSERLRIELNNVIPLIEADYSTDESARIVVRQRDDDGTIFDMIQQEGYDVAPDQKWDVHNAFGISRGAGWYAIGTKDAGELVQQAVRTLAEGELSKLPRRPRSAIHVTARGAAWQRLPIDNDDDTRILRLVGEEAFADADHASLKLHGIPNGARLELTLPAGFLRWAALMLATSNDQNEL
ncbi:MAG: hypothetical protein R3B90_09675 [Planctomycetaceae bacterium]